MIKMDRGTIQTEYAGIKMALKSLNRTTFPEPRGRSHSISSSNQLLIEKSIFAFSMYRVD